MCGILRAGRRTVSPLSSIVHDNRRGSLCPGEKFVHGGFTLVEVLVASVVLFSVLAVGTLSYRTCLQVMDRMTLHIAVSSALPGITQEVRARLLEGEESGEGTYSDIVRYDWKSRKEVSAKSVRGLSEVTRVDYGFFNLSLKRVSLTVTCEGRGDSKSFDYEYDELLWKK